MTGYLIQDSEAMAELIDSISESGIIPIVESFETILINKEKSTLGQCEMALSSAELVASLTGTFSEESSDEFRDKVTSLSHSLDQIFDHRIKEIAADVIDQLGAESELKILWRESEFFEKWNNHLIEIQNRLLQNMK